MTHPGFTMIGFGARRFTAGADDLGSRERPAHEVEVDAFALADRCVSAGDYHAFLADAPSDVDHSMIDCIDPAFVVHRSGRFALRPGCADLPMIQINFWGAAAYCNWLSRTSGLTEVYDVGGRTADLDRDGYRLPTEAEWEAACRAGRPDPHAPPDPDECNSAEAGPACRKLRAGESRSGAFPPGHGAPVPVGSLPADAAGLYEMLGNLREWCQDRFGPYGADPARNPRGPAKGAFRVVRGGSFIDPPADLRPAVRMAAFEDTRCEVYGFRVARSR